MGRRTHRRRGVSGRAAVALTIVVALGACTDDDSPSAGTGRGVDPSAADDGTAPSVTTSAPGMPEDTAVDTTSAPTVVVEASPPGLDSSAAQAILDGVDLADSDTLLGLDDARTDPGLVAAAESALRSGGLDRDARWAAAWVVVNDLGDADLLVPLTTDDDVSIRVMVATGLLAQGRIEGFAPLIEALTDETTLVGRYPPTSAWSAATQSLVLWTAVADNGPPFDADEGQRAAGQARWLAWLDANRAALGFDPEEARWVVG